MVASINRITDQGLEKYDTIDQLLIPSKDFIRNFGDVNDYVEAHIYTKDDRLLQSDYAYTGYTYPNNISIGSTDTVNSLLFDPAAHLAKLGYTTGDYKIDYRVYRKKLFELASKTFFISEVSSDSKEIRLISNIVSDSTIESNTLNFLYEIQSSPYFKDFLLNFGDNKTINAVNIALDKNTSPYSILVKLYQPLPSEFSLKSALWVVEELADPIQFEVELIPDVVPEVVEFLGPVNFDLNLEAHQAVSSPYQSLNSIYSTDSLTAYQSVVNRMNSTSLDINVNYADFNDFIHFSSATERLNNFVYKLQTIESYNANINTLKTIPNYTSGSVSASIQTAQNSINSIIQKFDGYENYLYTVSESAAWPKTGTYPSYSLAPTTSSIALSWLGSSNESSAYYGGMSYSASLYDVENQDNLIFSVPEYISADSNNDAYLLFLNMVGQHFDNIWIYIKALNDIHKANNSFKEGISKDMVYTALRSLGIKLYNNNSNENIFDYFIGNTSGSYTVNGSNTIVSGEDRSKEIFKRLYHNLPYLLKSKGTNRGIKALISTFGIPSTILDVIEYGGSDKFNDTLEYVYDRFTYALNSVSGSHFTTTWAPLTQNNTKYGVSTLVPDSIELKFKPNQHSINSNVTLLQNYSPLGAANFGVTMDYTSSNGVPSANVNLLLSDSTQFVSSSLTLPIYAADQSGDTSWWSLLLRRNTKYTTYNTASIQQYDLIIQNNISGRIGHQASASLYATGSNKEALNTSWANYTASVVVGMPAITSAAFPSGSIFNGELQELRYWSEPLSNAAFSAHTLSGESYEGNSTGSAFTDLAARFPLGNNLVTYNHSTTPSVQSVHPDHTVVYAIGGDNSAYFYTYPNANSYTSFNDRVYANAPNSGYYTPVSEKVRIVNTTVNGSVLSPYVRLESPEVYRTRDVHFTDVSFSPQNEINKDIIAEYGSTLNIDNLIGDPHNQYSSTYTDLAKLNQDYYKKFTGKYNYTDFIRLIRSVDNTLFKMIEDYVPARTNLSTGITIKSPLLERNRVQRHKPEVEDEGANEGVIEGVNIAADSVYTNVNGSTEEFITSELIGSTLDMDDEFTKNNYNPYLFPTQSVVDLYTFEGSDYNTQQGVVNQNRVSTKVQSLDGTVLVAAEIQDSYAEYRRHTLPRYEGSKSTSKYYNTYTPGDSAYGKNAAIDSNTIKFGWVNAVSPSNLNIYNKTTLNLKYLVDESGSLTELNSENKNLFEVQNIFKSGEPLTVSLFDKTTPTNQSSLSGVKNVHLGGFAYSPILFRELDETLYFNYLNPTTTQSLNLGVKAYSTSSFEYNRYDGATVWQPSVGAINTGAGYYYRVDGSTVNTTGVPIASTTYVGSSLWIHNSVSALSYTNIGALVFDTVRGTTGNTYGFDLMNFADTVDGYNTEPDTHTYTPYTNGNYYYKVPRTGTYNVQGKTDFDFQGQDNNANYSLFKVFGVIEKSTTPNTEASWVHVAHTTLVANNTPSGGGPGFTYNYDATTSTVYFDAQMTSIWKFTMDTGVQAVTLTAGDYVRFRFYFMDFQNGFTYWQVMSWSLSKNASFEIYDTSVHIDKLITSGSLGQVPAIFSYEGVSGKGIIFNDSASLAFYQQSTFVPNAPYSANYSPVTDIFSIQPGDLFRFGEFTSPASKYYEVDYTYTTPDLVVIFKSSATIPSGSINPNSFAVLRKVPDETSVILDYNKLPGATSKALIIPGTLKESIADNVANIVEPLRLSLSTQ